MRNVSLRRIGYADIPGGGQVLVENGLCFVGHMEPPLGTSILDVSDPTQPKIIAQLDVPKNTHSHKVRVHENIMLVNNEAHPNGSVGHARGFRIFDIVKPERPREISFYATGPRGVHRFGFDGRYAYLSTEMEGYQGNMMVNVDLADPLRPREVSRWWVPGQWFAGGETPTPPTRHNRRQVHHPLRFGNDLYVGCCNAGLAVVDVTDVSKPRTIANHPAVGLFCHTVLPAGSGAKANKYVVAVDEGWWDQEGGVTCYDFSDHATLKLVGRYDLPHGDGNRIWAAHQPHEEVVDDLLFVAWFGHGLRVLDVADPSNPMEVATFMPEERSDAGVMSNDVFVDIKNGLVYLIDRERGLDILELKA